MDSTQRMGLIVNMVFYVWMLWYLCRAYFQFRKSGGIKGFRRDKGLLPEEKLAKKAAKIGSKATGALDLAVDLELQRERYDENEA